MKTTLFKILCKDNVWRWVFGRSMNSIDPLTQSCVITTEDRRKAWKYYGEDTVSQVCLFEEASHGLMVSSE